VISLNSQPQP